MKPTHRKRAEKIALSRRIIQFQQDLTWFTTSPSIFLSCFSGKCTFEKMFGPKHMQFNRYIFVENARGSIDSLLMFTLKSYLYSKYRLVGIRRGIVTYPPRDLGFSSSPDSNPIPGGIAIQSYFVFSRVLLFYQLIVGGSDTQTDTVSKYTVYRVLKQQECYWF